MNVKKLHIDFTDMPSVLSLRFSKDAVIQAIARFDSGQTGVVDFHREIAQAGVVYVSVHLLSNCIYYMSQDGDFYLERY